MRAAPRTLRIAILECDEPIGRTKEKYGGYGNLFKELLERGAHEVNRKSEEKKEKEEEAPPVELEITKYDVVHHEVYPDVAAVDAVLLTGSRYTAFDDDAWILKLVRFTQECLGSGNGVRVIGVCFGHQIVGRALGVRVARAPVEDGWEVAVTEVGLSEKGREVFGLERLAIHQMHRDIVCEYPPGVEALGSSDRCRVQGMYAPKRLITVQGHPEFNGDIVTELLENRHARGIFDDGMFEDGMSRVRKHHDGVAVSVAFLRFLLE
ncbi:related to anthranilate synthase component II [Lecanosticta acicola]|uniref:Related to anthranilate synthase component II n=1 Tax=Lecanosticta acicola TaxID=111012 RepID=A0AAI8YVW2_9PEZI|nr:related to anthranilate synthase component II [Lecanosticta acicola]